MSTHAIQHQGKSFPLGSTLVPGGANFSVFAKYSTGAQLSLFDDIDAPNPSRVIDLDRGAITHTTIGTPLCPALLRARFMPIVSPARSILYGDYVSTRTRCCSILMVNA